MFNEDDAVAGEFDGSLNERSSELGQTERSPQGRSGVGPNSGAPSEGSGVPSDWTPESVRDFDDHSGRHLEADDDMDAEFRLPNLSGPRGPRKANPKPVVPDIRGASLNSAQKLLILDTWRRSGLPAGDFADLVGMSKNTLYSWKLKFQKEGPAGLDDKSKGTRTKGRIPDIVRRTILMLKDDHPDWGCQRISDMLTRTQGMSACATTVGKVLHEEGYELSEEPTEPHPDKVRRFERASPNQMWQTDLFTFVLKRQNRRVYLVAFMDDHSRFIVGYGLHASQSATLVIEVLRAGITSYQSPQEVLSDNGAQYITWRGTSAFAKELQCRGIKHIVSSPRHPQTLGKIERFWGTLWKECLKSAIFIDMADAQARIGHFIDYYNFRRPHGGLDGLVPADRFFNLAPQVKDTLTKRVAANALDLARNGIPKAPFYITGQAGGKTFSVHAEGQRVILSGDGHGRQEIDLIPPASPPESMPDPLCPHGQAASQEELTEQPLPPGVSALDEGIAAMNDALKTPGQGGDLNDSN